MSIFYNINLKYKCESGVVDTDKLFLVRYGQNFEYILFFKLKGEGDIGYTK